MNTERKKVAWGITGSGDRINEILEVVKKVKREYESKVEIRVYLSKAGAQVLKHYKFFEELEKDFGKLRVEVDSNTPFLAGALQLGNFEFLLIAPATSNTAAKISLGIADTLLSNSAIMALKTCIPVYIMPSDYREGTIVTELSDGQPLKLRIRKEDASHAQKLAEMDGVHVLEKTENIHQIFERHFKQT